MSVPDSKRRNKPLERGKVGMNFVSLGTDGGRKGKKKPLTVWLGAFLLVEISRLRA